MIYVALPVYNEMPHLSRTVNCVLSQSEQDFKLICCVNQPDVFWTDEHKIHICHNNQSAINYLKSLNDDRISVLDYSSQGKGWKNNKIGVGMARKVTMDYIASIAEKHDIILCLDADTVFCKDYFKSIAENISQNPDIMAISVPYYHILSEDENLNKALLRYEIYMRAYLINMYQINNPFSFTALGSAIATPVWAYNKIGGMAPKKSGEDFYFLQSMVKSGKISNYNSKMVFPATRFSDRVFFGTGPALIKGNKGDWSSYPIYSTKLFDDIGKTFNLFEKLFFGDVATPIDDFLIETFGHLPWEKLRNNCKDTYTFVKACYQKIDGLRILQYLKKNQLQDDSSDTKYLSELLQLYNIDISKTIGNLNLTDLNIIDLDRIRNILFDIEMQYRYKEYKKRPNSLLGLFPF
ncbi:MAG: hypothetical protein ACOXZ9_10620 [Bacteroidales bacterium]|jgi:glycosyltransferase involved in cell wall biosynthesis